MRPTNETTRRRTYFPAYRGIATGAFVAAAASAMATVAGAQCTARAIDTGGLALGDGTACAEAPVLETDIDISVTGLIARARVTQRFINPTDRWVEGIYMFPLPDGAAVDHLKMFVGSRIVEGRIEERTAARHAYTNARDAGLKASLVEQHRANVFGTSVANIGPGEEIEIDIELQFLARYDDSEFRLRFPTVVAPTYDPRERSGNPEPATECKVGVETTSRERPPVRVNPIRLNVVIEPGFPLRTVYSPTHLVNVETIGDGTAHHVTLATEGFADRDLVIAWHPERGSAPTSAIFQEEIDGDHFALLMVLPPDEGNADHRRHSREVIFAIDTSGSMGGASIRQARNALLLALDSLAPGDWFDVIDFDHDARSLFGDSVAASADTIDRARAFVDGLEADGGTNIQAALDLALAPGPARAEVRQVVFITDGAVGNEADIFRDVADRIGATRLFTIGIGSAPNAHFMRKAAHFGRGTYTTISNPSEVSERMGVLFEKLGGAVMTDIEIDWGVEWPEDISIAEVFPAYIPDLYRGEPLVVTARLAGRPGQVILSGKRDGVARSVVEALPTGPYRDRGIARLWARHKIDARMDDLALGDDREQVRRDVLDLALEHYLVTKYTSLVAVDVSATAPFGSSVRLSVPLNLPAGSLPRTATRARLDAVIATALLLAAALLWNGSRAPCEPAGPIAPADRSAR